MLYADHRMDGEVVFERYNMSIRSEHFCEGR
jgi:hypothetical protein